MMAIHEALHLEHIGRATEGGTMIQMIQEMRRIDEAHETRVQG